jgi:hypothetical protein
VYSSHIYVVMETFLWARVWSELSREASQQSRNKVTTTFSLNLNYSSTMMLQLVSFLNKGKGRSIVNIVAEPRHFNAPAPRNSFMRFRLRLLLHYTYQGNFFKTNKSWHNVWANFWFWFVVIKIVLKVNG